MKLFFKKNKKVLSVIIFSIFIALLVSFFFQIDSVRALGSGDLGMEYGSQTQLSSTDPRTVIARIIQILLGFLAILAVMLIVYAGFLWMTAKSDEAQVQKAKDILRNAVIGLIIILSAFGIATFILNSIVSATGGGSSSAPWLPAPPTPSSSVHWTPCDSDGDLTSGFCDLSSACIAGTYCDLASGCYCLYKKSAGEVCGEVNGSGVCNPHNEQCISDDCDVNTCLCNPTPIITSVTPYGGFCVDNVNIPCNSDDDCSGGKCDTVTPNGAIGNFISIRGEYFGDGSGASKVEFVDNSGSNQAGKVIDVNSNCNGGWTNNEIIVVLTSGNGTDSATTSIKVTVSDGKVDTTNDDKGVKVPDLVINNIVRPGVCKLNPNNAKAGENINVSGNNFEINSKFFFGAYLKKVESESFTFSSDISGVAGVPLISKGTTTSFMVNNVGGVDVVSNYIGFVKNFESDSTPYISYFSPSAGSIGQYVTIYGGGFKSFKGVNSSVKFVDGSIEVEADYIFPQICSDSIWKNNQIIVKVPDGVDYDNDGVYDESYKIRIQIGFLAPVESIEYFNASSSVDLLPSLCKIVPTSGPNNTPVDIWGEYFGDNHGSVKFYLDKIYKDSSSKITFWGIDTNYKDGIQKITTRVHKDASSGLVMARKKGKTTDSDFGNGLHFEVGMCNEEASPNDACIDNGGICCMSGYRQGSCVSNIVDCYSVATSSVYEWEFTTKYSGNDYGSCEEYHILEEECLVDKFCPNSPGNCSLNSGGSISIGASCDCNDYGDCASNVCNYDSGLDSCVYQNGSSDSTCNISTTTKDVNGKDVIAYCSDNGDWYFKESGSCPAGWFKNTDGDCATSSPACITCSNGECIDNNDSDLENGVCVAKHNICNGGVCNSGKCETNTNEICECCCRQNAEVSDCCTFTDPYTNIDKTLSCEGACGQYPADDDGFGRCTGCTIKDASGNIDQSASDLACNCSTVSGKYCDTSMANGRGVCMECGGLDMNLCSNHSDSCCVNAMNNNLCIGGVGDSTLDDSGNNIGYCGYYQCTQIQTESGNQYEGACSNERTKGSKGMTLFDNKDTCNFECSSNIGNGAEKSCYDRDSSSCSINCSYPNYCIGEEGGIFGQSVQGDDDTCKCCCNPLATVDECSEINSNMKCTPDMGDCTGDKRGLCCGCDSDYDCSLDPTAVGCGKDTCCHARPNIETVEPSNNSDNVCTNIQIKANFNTKMNETSLRNNFILLGKFDSECPDGTKYLSSLDQNFADNSLNIENKWSNVLDVLSKKAKAADSIYCMVNGGVNSEYDSDNNKTSLIFNASNLLATSTKYFAIIKGDEGLNSESGVLSSYNIGMNGAHSASQSLFNGIEYPNAYIWEFTTIAGQNNKGICEIDHIDITPSSYLFKTTEDDMNENDSNSTSDSYDSVSSEGRDSDKVFKAEAKNIDGQTLSPVAGVYDWNWKWGIDNDNVIEFENGTGITANELISAKTTITEGKANLTATATIVTALYGTSSDEISGVAEVWVFVCNNPWPAYKYSSGVYTWSPWRDSGSDDMNYELYYCKDNNEDDDIIKEDDLPTLKNNGSTRGEYSPLVCSDVIGDCIGKSSGVPCNYEEDAKGYCFDGKCSDLVGNCNSISDGEACSYSGICNTELRIKKETYFFREDDVVNSIVLNSLTNGISGQNVNLAWTDMGGTYDYFTIYYGLNSGNYTETIDYVKNSPYTINNLLKDTEYFFRIGGNTATGVEKLSDEKSIKTKDVTPPSNFDADFSVSAGDKKVYLKWKAPDDEDLSYFRAKWVAVSGSDCTGVTEYGESSDLLRRNDESFIIKKLANNVNYCVVLIAGDDSGNETLTNPRFITPKFGTEIKACPLGTAPNQKEGGKLGAGACMLTKDLSNLIIANMDLGNAMCQPISGSLLGGEKYKCRIELDKYELPSGWKSDITVVETSCVDDDGSYIAKLKDGEELVDNGDSTALKNKNYLELQFNPLVNSSYDCTSTIKYSLSDTKKAYASSSKFSLTVKQNPEITNIGGFSSNNKRVGDIVLVNADIDVANTEYLLDVNNISIQNKAGKIVGMMNKTAIAGQYSTTFVIESITEYFIHAHAYNKITNKAIESVSKIELGDILENIIVINDNVNSNIQLNAPIFEVSSNKIKLSWTDSGSEVIKYMVDYKLEDDETWQSVDNGMNREYMIENITRDKIYLIKIRGVNNDNTEVLSNQVNIKVKSDDTVIKPSNSISLAKPVYNKSSKQIKLSWTDSGVNTVRYNVDYKIGVNGSTQSVNNGLNREYIIKNVTDDKIYYINIRGVDNDNMETISNQVSIKINNNSSVVIPSGSYENLLFNVNASGDISTVISSPTNEDSKIEVLIILDDFTNVYSSETSLSTDWKNRISEIISGSNGITSRPPFSSNAGKFKWYLASVNSGENCYYNYCTSNYADRIDIIGKNGNSYFDVGTNWADNVIVLSDDPYYGYAYRETGWVFASGAKESYNITHVPNFGNVYYSLLAYKFSDNDYSLTFAMSQDYCNDHLGDFTGVPDCNGKIGEFQEIPGFDPDKTNALGQADLGMSYIYNFNGDVTNVNDFVNTGKIIYNHVFIYKNGKDYDAHYPIKDIVPSLVISHEFGHGFGLLLDEYTTGIYVSEATPNCSKTNTGSFTFKGCCKNSWYRSSNNSIMRDLSISGDGNTFNTVSQNWISDIFDCFGGSCSARCDICEINPHYFDSNSVVDCSTCP